MENVEVYQESDTDSAKSLSDATKTDSELRKKVYQVLQGDCLLNIEKISVRVLGRTVYLEGTVGSEKERNLVYEDITNIFGVRNVVNYLTFPCPYLAINIACTTA
ncbi:BON domain-containing protein [Dyadobacter psychrotolerans]|uniref:BON domain-containing protein n=1 Tax=Dyadobacter psychrotolerans TaxID=2541721 RepID=A0A4V2Z4T7_9BACT|nr:BON domain-containing protein [Dyadobacter psychrotolerans]TDE17988.1 BON domain-containing protein [Dyadobacter psychrotolerans]